MLMFGCAQAPGQGEPVVRAGAGATADGGATNDAPADAGTATDGADAGPAPDGADAGSASAGGTDGGSASAGGADGGAAGLCDRSIDARAGVVIDDTLACKGIMPAPPSCAVDVVACAGTYLGPNGLAGTVPNDATSDGSGAIALSCRSVDVGLGPGFSLYLPAAAGYATAASRLGEQLSPLASGAVGLSAAWHVTPNPTWDFFGGDGAHLGSIPQGRSLVLAAGGVVEQVTPTAQSGGWIVSVQKLGRDGASIGPAYTLGTFAASATDAPVIAGAVDANGHTLVIFGVAFAPFKSARWLAPDGTPETPAFEFTAWSNHSGDALALPGGGVAIRDSGIGGAPSPSWTATYAAGTTTAGPVPTWLAQRPGDFRLVRGGRAAAFVRDDHAIVAADGTVCGSIQLASGGPLWTGADGTVFNPLSDSKTFRVYPQLLR